MRHFKEAAVLALVSLSTACGAPSQPNITPTRPLSTTNLISPNAKESAANFNVQPGGQKVEIQPGKYQGRLSLQILVNQPQDDSDPATADLPGDYCVVSDPNTNPIFVTNDPVDSKEFNGSHTVVTTGSTRISFGDSITITFGSTCQDGTPAPVITFGSLPPDIPLTVSTPSPPTFVPHSQP